MGAVLIVLFGVLLPAATLAIELSNGMCAEAFFDPIPTLTHVLLVALVPAVNLLALLGTMRRWTKWRTSLLWANSVVIGIALVYTLEFLTLMPIAVIAIIAVGMGLLPLAPFFSLLCAMVLRRWLINMPGSTPDGKIDPTVILPPPSFKSVLGGAALGVLLLLALEVRTVVTLQGAQMAASDSADESVRGVRLLRSFGSRDTLLWMCYHGGRTRGPFDFNRSPQLIAGTFVSSIDEKAAQRVYFRVTGEPYNAVPPPDKFARRAMSDFDFDPDLGGEAVAGRRKGLSLSDSRIDAKVHPDAAVSYTEWTMVFKNDHPSQREARANILLPPGGVVSRVTLWVNGEPREAAFGGSGQVREAYKKVAIQQRRDPLLVTWAGNNRVLVQCFPVQPYGTMKIRLGITAPLLLQDPETAALQLPRFAERNFSVPGCDIHSLWIESDADYKRVPDRLHREKSADAKHVVRGQMSDEEINSGDAAILMARAADAVETWTPDPQNPKKFVLQKLVADKLPGKRQMSIVVDGSRAMADHFQAIADALAATDPNVKLQLFFAGDEAVEIPDAAQLVKEPNSLAERFRSLGGVGGCDNVPALLRAFNEADGDRTVVWVHAAQPVLLQPVTSLAQWMERDKRAAFHDFAVAGGPDCVVEQLGAVGSVLSVPRLGNVSDDLRNLLARLAGQAKVYRLDRVAVEKQPPNKPKASSHLARLWAADQVAALLQAGKAAQRTDAVKLAAAYQLVTPVSGAVVLENQQQYDEAKLHPGDPDEVPSIPEPGTLVLLLTALFPLIWFAWERRTAVAYQNRQYK
jgi:hypothetical protein